MSRPIILGYDGSAASDRALHWAVTAAAQRGLPLKVLVAWAMPPGAFGEGAGAGVSGALMEELRTDADVMLRKAVSKASEWADDVELSGDVVVSTPSAALVERSHDASLLVVGSHGRGGFAGLLLGSVSRQVAAHASCPVVVVREPADPAAREVVVGVDGSKESLNALDFAFDHASRQGLRLRVVHTWEVPPAGVMTAVPMFPVPEVLQDIKGNEMRMTAEALAGHRDRYPDVVIDQEVMQGSPTKVLVDLSNRAALVVVGSRGRGGFLGLLLGSVSHGVLHHAHCPVVVVH